MMWHMKINPTAAWIVAGALCGVALIGGAAAAIWNSKQMKTFRAVKCGEKILYQVGTAMRDLSGCSSCN